ncbi:outer membrane beta-barrel protein [Aureivirga marina]|uniref:outer membrane beta-barrel protein n=1 Tax=Aureivirga marina TaxID=1182451 RepID=UPI0018CBA203|nr:outer membrane beta-barrel family protein [Aureivirga marina]
MKLRILFIFLFGINIVYSQVEIKGLVKDTLNQPIEFANVVLKKLDGRIISGTTTDQNGKFQLKSGKEEFILQVSYFGYKEWKREIAVKDELILFEDIILRETNNLLGEVIITSNKNKIIKKVDRLVFDVRNTIVDKFNGDAVDILSITPSVIIEDESINIFGKEKVIVLINGRDTNLTGVNLSSLLKTMKASEIESIEVMSNPPAKYDAEGNVGIVNIITRKREINYWSSNVTASYRQGEYAFGEYLGAFNYMKDKLSFSAGFFYTKGNYGGEENSTIFYPERKWKQTTDYKFAKNFLSTRFSIDYEITKKWSIGGQFIGNYNKPDQNDESIVFIEDSFGFDREQITNNGNQRRKRDLNSINFHSVFDLNKNRNLNFDLDYFKYTSYDDRTVTSTRFPLFDSPDSIFEESEIISDITQDITNISSKIDVTYPYKNYNINFGGKASFSKTKNDLSLLGIQDVNDQFDVFEYKEDIQALYVSASNNFGLKNWSFKAGLRAENTEIVIDNITLSNKSTNSYLKLFPTLYVNYSPTKKHNLSLNYGKRIYRPGFRSLNPFRIYTTPYTYSEGNPNLVPVIATNIELESLYDGKNYFSLYFVYEEDNFGQVVLLSPDNLTQAVTRLNYFDSYSIGIRENYLLNKVKWLESIFRVNLFYNHSNSKIYPLTPKSTSGFGGIFNLTNYFTIDTKSNSYVGFDFTYRTPLNSNDLSHNFERYLFNVFVKLLFLKKKLEVSMKVNNIFKEYNFNTENYRNGIKTMYDGYYDTRFFKLSLTYSFGSKKIRSNKRRVTNSTEKNRTSF